ncbi:MAG: hypothetical protein ACR2JB_19875 [Bryobacteraceae bacterium]
MGTVATAANIPESFLEHRQSFAAPWVDRWILPNPFISAIHGALKELGVELTDFSFNKDAISIGDTFLNIAIRRLNAAVRIGLDSVTFSAANPDWGTAPRLISSFEQVTHVVREIVRTNPAFQETTLALHVSSETVDLRTATASLVNKELLGESVFYGISLHRGTGTLMIDKSLRYDHAAFVRLQRRSLGEDSFAEIASKLYEDEVFAFRLLGLIDE